MAEPMSSVMEKVIGKTASRAFIGPVKPFIGYILPLVQPIIRDKPPLVGIGLNSSDFSRSSSGQHGFTLIELVITLVLVTILLALAVPNMRDALWRNKVITAANEFVALLNLARGEALRTGSTTAVCRSPDPEAAAPACNVANYTGWLAYRYGNADINARAYNSASNDVIVRVAVLPITRGGGGVISSNSVILAASSDNDAIIAFNSVGGLVAGAQDYALCNYELRGNDGRGRIVNLSAIGRPSVRATNPAINAEKNCFLGG